MRIDFKFIDMIFTAAKSGLMGRPPAHGSTKDIYPRDRNCSSLSKAPGPRGPIDRTGTLSWAFLAALAGAFLVPAALPKVGLDYPYLSILLIVLFAWFIMKWETFRSLAPRRGVAELLVGAGIVVGDYGANYFLKSPVGLVDLLTVLSGVVLAFYGLGGFRVFWVPLAYGGVLLLGYQVENLTPNYAALQDWMAGLMAAWMNAIGVSATVYGHVVSLNSGAQTLLLSVESDCTGIQGVLAFGMLSTMAILDTKPRISRLIPLFLVGLAGAFLINLVRLLLVFVTFEFAGPEVGTAVHTAAGYGLFVVWIIVFWAISMKYLARAPAPLAGPGTAG